MRLLPGHDGSPASVLAAHFVGEANRSAAECFLVVDRGGVAGDFIVRESKGCTVLSLVIAGKKMVHNRVQVAEGGVVLVNNRPASVVAVTLAEAIGAWLASPERAAADLLGTIAAIKPDVYNGDAYEEGSAFLDDELDVYAESTDEVRTAAAVRQTYHFASARPARLSTGRQGLFQQQSIDAVELEAVALPGREVSEV